MAQETPYLIVLGIAQDGGYPQAGCRRECCAAAWKDPAARRHVACLAIVDPQTKERWLLDATPDFPEQLRMLDERAPAPGSPGLAGILLTHGHIGHYTGLMHLGREVMGARGLPVYAMPRMRSFLGGNGPWELLIRLGDIELKPLSGGVPVALNERISVTPFAVPHRDEYTETVGYRIQGPERAAVYLPDIDKWEKWEAVGGRVEGMLEGVSRAYLDGTFYAEGEIPGRSMAEVPHPFIEESLRRFAPLPAEERAKIRFLHFNHTNPALQPGGAAKRAIEAAGLGIAEELETFGL